VGKRIADAIFNGGGTSEGASHTEKVT
jgi:hypothetical protein